jgi:hypothetical protein
MGLGAVAYGDPLKPELEAAGRILHVAPEPAARAG